jgi:hypothetical protein
MVLATSQQEFSDADFRVVDNADQSKKLAFQVSGVTTATTRTLTVPDASGTIMLTSDIVSGTFTPGMTFGGSATGVTFTTQDGRYTRIGDVVTFAIHIILTSNGTGVGAALVTGLPFTNGSIITAVSALGVAGFSGITMGVGAEVNASATTIALRLQDATGSSAATDTNVTNTANFRLAGTYFV